MLNLEDTLIDKNFYDLQSDRVLRILPYLPIGAGWLSILRRACPEIILFQLQPGFIFLFIFFAQLYFFIYNNSLYKPPYLKDMKRNTGMRNIFIFLSGPLIRIGVFLFITICFLLLLYVIPLGLDTLDSFDINKNEWDYSEVCTIEMGVIITIALTSQFPIYFGMFRKLDSEDWRFLSIYWKQICLGILIFTAAITPTVDLKSQISVTLIVVFILLNSIFYLKKILELPTCSLCKAS
uniref:Sec-independent translocase component C n=1 Tax=Neotessella volvocina TaxID=52559 RepID=A0A3G2QZT8_9STRA|nr:Sec-independent translocase component C [Neotessella volvocina]